MYAGSGRGPSDGWHVESVPCHGAGAIPLRARTESRSGSRGRPQSGTQASPGKTPPYPTLLPGASRAGSPICCGRSAKPSNSACRALRSALEDMLVRGNLRSRPRGGRGTDAACMTTEGALRGLAVRPGRAAIQLRMGSDCLELLLTTNTVLEEGPASGRPRSSSGKPARGDQVARGEPVSVRSGTRHTESRRDCAARLHRRGSA